LQLRFWQSFPIRIHAADFDQRWSDVQAEAERFAGRVLAVRPYADVSRRWFRFVGDLRKRGNRYGKAWRRRTRRVRTNALGQRLKRQIGIWQRRRPQMPVKQMQRPLKLLLHRVAKRQRSWVKRMQRRMWGRTTSPSPR
jgi:hypothetical protein